MFNYKIIIVKRIKFFVVENVLQSSVESNPTLVVKRVLG